LSRVQTSIHVRPWRDGDLDPVLSLLQAALGGGPAGSRPAEFFAWKHFANPFGRSFMLVAEMDGRPIGLRAFMRWRFRVGDRTVEAVRAVDTATYPDHQGRGIFSMLTRQAIESMPGEVELIFNTPNEKSMPGYLKMGWRVVGRVPISIGARRPLRVALGLRSVRGPAEPRRPKPEIRCITAAEALVETDPVAELLHRARFPDGRLATDRDVAYLRWRYASAPLLDYRAVRDDGPEGLRGLALFRVRPRGRLWECTVAELIVRDGDRSTAGRLLRRIRRTTGVDHVAVSFPPRSAQASAAARHGFVHAPGGPTMVVNPLRGVTRPDPLSLGSWAVGLGDLEVF
jgi:GNAT superfamily N-acetyltransferase